MTRTMPLRYYVDPEDLLSQTSCATDLESLIQSATDLAPWRQRGISKKLNVETKTMEIVRMEFASLHCPWSLQINLETLKVVLCPLRVSATKGRVPAVVVLKDREEAQRLCDIFESLHRDPVSEAIRRNLSEFQKLTNG